MPSNDLVSTPLTDVLVRGSLGLERTERGLLPHRLPAWVREQFPDPQLLMAESQASGVRLVLRTSATTIELDTLRTKRTYVGAPQRPDGVYDLVVDGRLTGQASTTGGNTLTVDMVTGAAQTESGPPCTVRFEGLPDTLKDVEIWLPHNETTELIALRANAAIHAAPNSGRRQWLHHGSSISHGSDAASPTTTWPAVAARLGDADLINLGLGGSALLDPFMGRVMRDTAADLISIKIGINLVNTDLMRRRAFIPAVHGFLDCVREAHPTTPLLVISPILCPIHEDTPGPSAPDLTALREGRIQFRAIGDPAGAALGQLTLTMLRAELHSTPSFTTSTARSSTGTRTPPRCPYPTSCTRTRPPTAASANASRHLSSKAAVPLVPLRPGHDCTPDLLTSCLASCCSGTNLVDPVDGLQPLRTAVQRGAGSGDLGHTQIVQVFEGWGK